MPIDSLYDVTPKFLAELEDWLNQKYFKRFNEIKKLIPSGAVLAQGNYTAGTKTLAAAANGNLSLTYSSGDALLDLSSPAAPTVKTAGIYIFSCLFRQLNALGAPAAGSSFQGAITGAAFGVGHGFLTYPTAGSGYIPQHFVTTPLTNVTAGATILFNIKNADTVNSLSFDSPGIEVAKLS